MTLDPRFVEELQALAIGAGRFNVSLGNAIGFDLSKAEIARICAEILTPALAGADHCLLYGQEDNEVFQSFRANVTQKGRTYSIDPTREVMAGFENFWGAYGSQRGTVVLTSSASKCDLPALFAKTWDPGFLGNLSSIASRSAVAFAKRTATEGRIAFLLSANRGLNELFIFAGPAPMPPLVRSALARCRFSPRYLKLRGQGS